MATAAQNPQLPLFYQALEPVNVTQHGTMKVRQVLKMGQIGTAHAIPVTVDEFGLAQRHYPLVFSIGDQPIPIALMGLNENVNVFLDADGRPIDTAVYIPAYIRRYPFMLVKLQPDSDQLSLCVDPHSGAVVDKKGDAQFFDGDQPSQSTNDILQFCEQFEQAAQRTNAFMRDLQEMKLLMEGEVAIQPEGSEQPFLYRGFQMVDEDKFRDLRGDELRKLNQNGMLGIIMAHLFSLSLVRDIFARQVAQGTGPQGAAQAEPATAEA